ncbi:MAG: trimethylamine methyltransferase family protein [Desulfohalobiaceae bacterium]|nr:trimethylamine methyltransferase family protein [Desulfohalobiaceae bacterium]
MTALVPALAGANMIYGIGMIDSALAWDYASALLQNEFLDMVLKVVNGIQVTEENIAYDVIKEVGPAGEFITHEHTFKHFNEMSRTGLMDRRSREQWEASGSPDIVEKAYEKSLDILENYKPEPRPDDVQKELDSIYAEFEERVAERKAREAAGKN